MMGCYGNGYNHCLLVVACHQFAVVSARWRLSSLINKTWPEEIGLAE